MRPLARRDRVFAWALAFSFLFHLSMVTVFRIVIYFPRPDLAYYDLSIVEGPSTTIPGPSLGEALEVPSADDALERLDATRADLDPWSALPPVALPSLNFSELDLIRLNRSSLDTRTQYEDKFENKSDDLWARFGQGLSNVGDFLTGSDSRSSRSDLHPNRMFVGHPAPGFEAYLEWMSEPYDRRLLVLAKIDALWGASPSDLESPLVLVVRVNEQGRVTFVQMPLEDQGGLMESSAAAMFKVLFEPLETPTGDQQHATLIIQPERNVP